jgi:hypothetical protein
MLPAIRDNRMMQEAIKLAKDGELGNSDAIRLLQIPHHAEDVKDVLAIQATDRRAKSADVGSFVPLPGNVDNQRVSQSSTGPDHRQDPFDRGSTVVLNKFSI